MTEETQVQTNSESVGQEAQTTSSDDSVDYKALYLEEVNNAKKLRKRAQDAEGSISEYKTAQETDKVRQLKEQEKYKELSESLQSKLDDVSPFKEKWENFESNERERLLSKLPKEDREGLAQESLKTLNYITSKLDNAPPTNSQHQAGATPRNIKEMPDENIFGMSPEDRKKHWDGYMSNLANQKK